MAEEIEKTKTSPVADKTEPAPNQGETFGKSELLDAGHILKEILGLKAGDMIADFGAGGGLFSTQAAIMVGDQGQVYAVDIIKNVLSEIDSKAKMKGLTNIKTIWSNVEMIGATKIGEVSLNSVMLVNILFQSDKHFEMMAEATRLLKPGGQILVIDWSDTNAGFAPPTDRQVDPTKLAANANQLNLTLTKEFKAGNYHFGQIYTKN